MRMNMTIVHGNIKPENILFDANDQAVLADFNLVSRKDAIIRDQTSEEYAFCYLAPEQFAGTCDARSDQYALGCLAYELITGRVPFAEASAVGMMHASPWWIAGADGGLERSNSEPCIDRAADGITYDPSGPSIEDRSQVHKASRDCDISDVGHPELVGTVRGHGLRAIREDRIIVIAICRRDKPPVLLWIERMLAHEPTDLLGVHDNAAMTEFGVNPPIAIGFELVTNRFHLRNDS